MYCVFFETGTTLKSKLSPKHPSLGSCCEVFALLADHRATAGWFNALPSFHRRVRSVPEAKLLHATAKYTLPVGKALLLALVSIDLVSLMFLELCPELISSVQLAHIA